MWLGNALNFKKWRRTEYSLWHIIGSWNGNALNSQSDLEFPFILCCRLENTKSCQTRNELNAPRSEDRQKLFIPGWNERERRTENKEWICIGKGENERKRERERVKKGIKKKNWQWGKREKRMRWKLRRSDDWPKVSSMCLQLIKLLVNSYFFWQVSANHYELLYEKPPTLI